MTVSNIVLEDDNDVQRKLDKLISESREYPEFLPIFISNIEERYYSEILATELRERSVYPDFYRLWLPY